MKGDAVTMNDLSRAETIVLARQGVTMVTRREADGVLYEVYVGGDLSLGDRSNARRVWRRFVPWTQSHNVRVVAAREQTSQADRLTELARSMTTTT